MIFKSLFLSLLLGVSPAFALSFESIAAFKQGLAEQKAENIDAAKTHYEKALALDPKNHLFTERVADFYFSTGNYERYIALMLASFDLRAQRADKDALFTRIQKTAEKVSARIKFAQAVPFYEKAIALSLQFYPQKDNLNFAEAHYTYARALLDEEKYLESRPFFQAALLSLSKISTTHLDKKSLYLNDFGVSYYDAGDFAEAEPLYLEAVALSEVLNPGKDTAMLALRYNNLAKLYGNTSRPQEAIAMFKKTVQAAEKIEVNPDSEELAGYYRDLAHKLAEEEDEDNAANNNEKADVYYLKAIAVAKNVWPKPDFQHSTHLVNLAKYYTQNKRFQEAESYYQQALAIDEKLYPEKDDIDLEKRYNALGSLYERQDKYDEAIVYYQKSIEVCENLWPKKEMPFVGLRYTALGDTFYIKNRIPEAEKMYKNAIAVGETTSLDNLDLAHFYANYALFLHKKQKNNSEAERFYIKSIKIFEANKDPEADGFETAVTNYAEFLTQTNKKAQAIALRKKHPY